MKRNLLGLFILSLFSFTFISCSPTPNEEQYKDEIESAVFLLSSGVKSDYQGFTSAKLDDIYLTFENDNPVVVIKSSVTSSNHVFSYYTLVTFLDGMTNEVYVGSSDTLIYVFQETATAYENNEEDYYQIDITQFEDYYQEVLG